LPEAETRLSVGQRFSDLTRQDVTAQFHTSRRERLDLNSRCARIDQSGLALMPNQAKNPAALKHRSEEGFFTRTSAQFHHALLAHCVTGQYCGNKTPRC
jgi:hypothetical protein